MLNKNFAKNIALVTASLLLALLFCELVLRIIGFSYPNYYTYDKYTGAKLRPNAEGWYREEGEAYIKVNSDGMRDDREISLVKPADTFRIAVLGDSYVEALQIPTADTFLSIMEKKLNECDAFKGRKVEVLNFGVSGYSTGQELLTLQHRVWPYQPDMVILEFLAGNDIRDNSKRLSSSDPRPFFNLVNGHIQLDDSFANTSTFRFKSSTPWTALQSIGNHFRLIQLAVKVRNTVGRSSPKITAPLPPANGHQLGLDDSIYIEPTDSSWKEAWDITEKLLITIWKEVDSHHSKFLLVDITNGIDVLPDSSKVEQYMDSIGVHNLDYPHKRIERLANREGIPLIGLQPSFSAYSKEKHAYLHGFPKTGLGFGHWNKTAHRLAAENISARICTDATQNH